MASHYEESLTTEAEEDLHDDVQRIKYIKRLLSNYSRTGVLKTRLIVNHIIILMNTLGPFATTRVLLYKTKPEHHEIVATFLNEINGLDDFMQKATSIDVNVSNKIREDML